MAAAVEVSSERVKGTVRWFNATKGSGFVIPDYGNELIFFHLSSLKSDGFHTLNGDDIVEFVVITDRYGISKAVDVTAPGGGDLAGGFHADGGDGGDGDLGYGGGGRYGGNGSRDCCVGDGYGGGDSICYTGREVAALPVVFEGTALKVLDGMPLGKVIWDEEFGNGLDLDGGLLHQLAMGADYVIEEETIAVSDEQDIHVAVSLSESTPTVFDEMSSSDVLWDDMSTNQVTHDGLLQQIAQVEECPDDEKLEEIAEMDAPASTGQECGFCYDSVEQLAQGGEERKSTVGSCDNVLTHDYGGVVYAMCNLEVEDDTLLEMGQPYQKPSTNIAQSVVSNLSLSPLNKHVVLENQNWHLDGFSPWSSRSPLVLKVMPAWCYGEFSCQHCPELYMATIRIWDPGVLEVAYRSLYISVRQLDPGILGYAAANAYEISCSVQLHVQSSGERVLFEMFRMARRKWDSSILRPNMHVNSDMAAILFVRNSRCSFLQLNWCMLDKECRELCHFRSDCNTV